jgi:hypothetical protein
VCGNITDVLLLVGGDVKVFDILRAVLLLDGGDVKVSDILRAVLLLVGGDVKVFDILRAVLLLDGGDLKVFQLLILFQISRCVLQLHCTVGVQPFGAGIIFLILAHPIYKM